VLPAPWSTLGGSVAFHQMFGTNRTTEFPMSLQHGLQARTLIGDDGNRNPPTASRWTFRNINTTVDNVAIARSKWLDFDDVGANWK